MINPSYSAKILLSSLVFAGLSALSAAQFGAASKVDLLPTGDKTKQDIVANFFLINRDSGGDSRTGFLANFEKALTLKNEVLTSVSGFFSTAGGVTTYNGQYRAYLGREYGAAAGVLLTSGVSPTYTLFGFYDLPASGKAEKQLKVQLGAGLLFDITNRQTDTGFYLRASYPLERGLTADLSLLRANRSSAVFNTFALGVGYRF